MNIYIIKRGSPKYKIRNKTNRTKSNNKRNTRQNMGKHKLETAGDESADDPRRNEPASLAAQRIRAPPEGINPIAPSLREGVSKGVCFSIDMRNL